MHLSNTELTRAFPAALRKDAVVALSAFAESSYPLRTFSLRIADGVVALPFRIYHNPALIQTASLTSLQRELVDCLLTRHNDGFIRQQYLTRIICSNHVWIPPFVVQLAGEYVIEILQVIQHHLSTLDNSIYEQFFKMNPQFLTLTEQRVISYWNCYYRDCRRDEYVGFQLVDFFKSLVAKTR